MTQGELEIRFGGPYELDGEQRLLCECIRNVGRDLALCINDLCPDSEDKRLAFIAVEEAVMRANKSIAESRVR